MFLVNFNKGLVEQGHGAGWLYTLYLIFRFGSTIIVVDNIFVEIFSADRFAAFLALDPIDLFRISMYIIITTTPRHRCYTA